MEGPLRGSRKAESLIEGNEDGITREILGSLVLLTGVEPWPAAELALGEDAKGGTEKPPAPPPLRFLSIKFVIICSSAKSFLCGQRVCLSQLKVAIDNSYRQPQPKKERATTATQFAMASTPSDAKKGSRGGG